MDLEEYYNWQRKAQPKVHAESTKKRWRAEARAAIQKAIASVEPSGDVMAAVDAAYPFNKKDCDRYLIWLQERHAALRELGLLNI